MFERGSYIKETDYKSLFMKEFRNRIDNVAGNEVKIWDGVEDEILGDWIDRWEDKKKLSEKDWYSKYYQNFYEQTYLPYMDDFASYLLEGSSAPKSDFWRWYLNTYLRENKYL